VGYPGSKKISTEQLLTTSCDVLVPAALENQITPQIARNVDCKIIAEAANGPTTPEADEILHKDKIMVIPDILANSGGVCISYLEWVQNLQRYYWTFDEVAGKMEKHIVRGFNDTYALSKKHNVDMRKASMVLAVGRVLEAYDAIHCETGKESQVIRSIMEIKGVKEVIGVLGLYDVIAKIEAQDSVFLEQIITKYVRKVPHVLTTMTLIVI